MRGKIKGNFGVLKVSKEKQKAGGKYWYLELKTRAQPGSGKERCRKETKKTVVKTYRPRTGSRKQMVLRGIVANIHARTCVIYNIVYQLYLKINN